MSNSSSKGTALVTGASRGIEILLLKERLNPSCIQQKSRDLNLWQACHEIAEKSSKTSPLGAPSHSINANQSRGLTEIILHPLASLLA
jgi:hypothetical protein